MSNIKTIAAVEESTLAKADFPSQLPGPALAPASATPQTLPAVKAAVQELLRAGVVEVAARSRLFEALCQYPQEVAQALEPLDLQVRLDEVRGLAYLCVGQGFAGDAAAAAVEVDAVPTQPAPEDGWSHPLVRRQRLTLEQSLLLALLRQHYLAHEQQAGIGGGTARVDLAELGAELATHLGHSGSDQKDDKRLRQLLATLKEHGVVGEVEVGDRVPIRPLIAHLANPASLLALLTQFLALAGAGQDAAQGEGEGAT